MEYGCIGEKLTHSFSREIHNRIASYPYELHELAPSELDGFLRRREFRAINVTIPYKQAVLPYLDHISEQAKKIGAVNTIVNREGKLFGYNTDFFGLSALLNRIGIRPAGQKVLVLGTGGTSKTACAVLESMGTGEIIRVSRTGREGSVTYDEAIRAHRDASYLINTTPCGMFPAGDAQPISLCELPALRGVADVIYNPLCTRLVTEALHAGLKAEGGLFMLVAQAVAASELFTGETFATDPSDAVFRALFAGKENIVLTGMPGSGKTTVGKLLAERLSRPFLDLDERIEAAAGMPVTEIFRERGETGFRELEEQVIREQATPLTGCVIATGGGAILRDINVTRLKQNGRVYLIDRPPEELVPTPDRPLALCREAIRKRYEERHDRYFGTCDTVVRAGHSPEETADRLLSLREAGH